MGKNLGHNFICEHADTETELPFCTRITRFAIPCKFKQSHLNSCNGIGSLIDNIRTYSAQIALATNTN